MSAGNKGSVAVSTENPGKKSVKSRTFHKYLFLSVLLIGPILNWALFWLVVNLSSIGLAFRDARTDAFTFENFKDVWMNFTSKDGTLLFALLNTAKYFFSNLLIVIPLSIIIGFFIYKKIFLYRVFNVIFYLPCIISSVALTIIYSEVLGPNGPIDQLFHLNVPPEGLFMRSATATNAIVAYTIWTGFGGNILLFVGAMTRIPLEILESAKLEGCGPWREIAQIILPLIWPTISSMMILAFTGLFTASGPILLFSPNGDNNTMTLSFWIFKQVYGTGEVGGTGSYNLVSATGLCLTIVGMPIILFARWLVERVPETEY